MRTGFRNLRNRPFEAVLTWPRAAVPGSATPRCGCNAPILAAPGQSEPSRRRPFVPIARLLPYGDRRAAPDKVASSRISPNLIRNGSVALAQRWGDRRRKSLRISHVGLQRSPVSMSHSVRPLGRLMDVAADSPEWNKNIRVAPFDGRDRYRPMAAAMSKDAVSPKQASHQLAHVHPAELP